MRHSGARVVLAERVGGPHPGMAQISRGLSHLRARRGQGRRAGAAEETGTLSPAAHGANGGRGTRRGPPELAGRGDLCKGSGRDSLSWWGGLRPNAASFFKWGPGVCTQIVAKGNVVDSGRPNALGYRTVARLLQMRERARHRAIRAFQRHSWRRVPCKKGPPCLAASLCAHYGPPATRRRAH